MLHVGLRFSQGLTFGPLFVSLRGKYVFAGEWASANDVFDPSSASVPPGVVTDSYAVVTYSDLAGLFRYQATFIRDGSATRTAYPLTTAFSLRTGVRKAITDFVERQKNKEEMTFTRLAPADRSGIEDIPETPY